ncbi:SUKH-3 domain-containing protein [Streptomyces swartbergensis]|uniref:SUKH-3 domain-containing protein n=1 Tax=Streptomyces swartbergensis TaxID=487165 RepID=UPI0037F8F695
MQATAWNCWPRPPTGRWTAWSRRRRPGLPSGRPTNRRPSTLSGGDCTPWRPAPTPGRAGGRAAGSRAGRFPQRPGSIPLQTGEFEIHDAARRFLAEFGAVGLSYRDPWDSMPWMEFSLDPLPATWDAEIIDDLAEHAGVDLYPIDMRDRGNQHLAMAEDGSVYAGMDSIWLLAPTPDEALQKLTSRIRPTASSRPGRIACGATWLTSAPSGG